MLANIVSAQISYQISEHRSNLGQTFFQMIINLPAESALLVFAYNKKQYNDHHCHYHYIITFVHFLWLL